MDSTARQPGPVADLWDWQHEGLCRTTDPEEFFHPEGERGERRRRRDERAKRVCRRCPVIEKCREHALAAREPYGVWGGLTEGEREELLDRSELKGA
ncbi:MULTISPECIES: WhiB family transcriptional regulator [Kytococcus]|uniref:Transcriptional regulator WhiB n=1 Tax=Kytococcus schroeteri TaxID=138300 RepID=A0A2I1P8U2_9MICO|nr:MULTISPECIES: WhiB family transcriptional regulator [Kytococcus]OFS15232.1 transcription factor WhiB [Kytococcus sp. HMSC28H12]PKZ41038.1 WhiB family transcriptional regulator [Kytococcus schroeteri]